MKLLLISNSTNAGEEYLRYPMPEIGRFLQGVSEIVFVPYAAVTFSYAEYEKKVRVHWSTAAEEVCGVTYEEGQFHMLENREKEGTVYTKNHIDPMLAVAPLENDPKAEAVAEEAKVSAETFQEHSKMAQLVVSTDEMAEYNGDLTTLKNEVIAKVVTQGMSVEDGMAYFDQQGGNNWSQKIVDSLNN